MMEAYKGVEILVYNLMAALKIFVDLVLFSIHLIRRRRLTVF